MSQTGKTGTSLLLMVFCCTALSLLTACGGGGTAGTSEPDKPPRYYHPTRPNLPPANYQVVNAPEVTAIGQTISMAVMSDLSEIVQVSWAQTSGAPLTPSQPQGKVLAVSPVQSDTYAFEAHMTFEDGSVATHAFGFDAVDLGSVVVNITADRAVLMGQTVSLRAHRNAEYAGEPVTWRSLNEPPVAFVRDARDTALIHVTAPTIAQDSVLVFEASLGDDEVPVAQDTAVVLVEPAPALPYDPRRLFHERLTRTHAYRAESPFADDLAYCTYSNEVFTDTTCAFLKLPLLGQAGDVPTLPQVMDRLLVSQDWMGQRFEEFLALQAENPDFLHLFRSITAIVIADDVTRSFYDAATGALYLKPKILALTPAERWTLKEPVSAETTTPEPQFFTRWRYVLDGQPLLSGGSIAYASTQTYAMAELQFEIARTLYHELAHAADFFSPSALATIPEWQRPYEYASERMLAGELASDQLTVALPAAISPEDTLLETLAAWIYEDQVPAVSGLHGTTAEAFAQAFEQAQSVDPYAFTDPLEDFAMLYEASMMQLRYGAARELGVFDRSAPGTLVWGQHGRVGDERILQRARLVMSAVREDLDAEIILGQIGAAEQMVAGSPWAISSTGLAGGHQ